MKNLNQWSEELFSLDVKPNHQNNIDQMFFAYLESETADDCKERREIIVLYRHLIKLFKTTLE